MAGGFVIHYKSSKNANIGVDKICVAMSLSNSLSVQTAAAL